MLKKTVIVVGALIVATVALSVGSRWFVHAHTTSWSNACINNLRRIDAAKQQWMVENHKTTNDLPTWDAVRPYLGPGTQGEVQGDIPICPQHGTYTLGSLTEDPKCSIGGPKHSLPSP